MADKIYDWQQFIPQDLYDLEKGSINYKFFEMLIDYGVKTYQNIDKTDEWKSIDKAEGKALDKIGENFDEYRGEADDQFFRFMIKSKILASRSKGTANDIINVIKQSLNVDINKINVIQNRNYDDASKTFKGLPYTISVEKLPLSFTTNDFQKRLLIKRIEESSAEGIKLNNISFLDFGNANIYVPNGKSFKKTYTNQLSSLGYELGKNIFSEKNSFVGYLSNLGNLIQDEKGKTSDFLLVQYTKILIQIFGNFTINVAFYDKNKNFISTAINYGNTYPVNGVPVKLSVTPPNNATYFRICFYTSKGYKANKKVEFGENYTDWSANPDDL